MELKVICKRLITQNLDGNITEGEYGADIVGISVPKMYGEHDLSEFSFRLTAVSKLNESVAEQVLTMDSIDDDNIHLLWKVTSDFTASSGEVTLVLAGVDVDNTVQIKFISQPVTINDDCRLEFIESPTILEQAYNQVQLEVQKAVDAAERAEEAAAGITVPVATETEVGGIISGGDISVDENGTVTVNSVNGKTVGVSVPEDAVFTDTLYTLPVASDTILGGVKVDNDTIKINSDGVICSISNSSVENDKTLSGNSSYTVSDAVSYPIIALNLYGNSVQDGTPTPEAPIDIVSVGDDGNLKITSRSKNLFDFNVFKNSISYVEGVVHSLTNNGINITVNDKLYGANAKVNTNYYINVTPGKKYTMSMTTATNQGYAVIYGNNKSEVQRLYATGSRSHITFDIPSDVTQVCILLWFDTVNESNTFSNFQLEEASVATAYVPYGNTATITSGLPLCSVGDVRDELVYKADGTGKILKRTAKLDSYNGEAVTTDYISSTGGLDTGAEIVYVLENPIENELTAVEITALMKLQTFAETTYIYNDEDAKMEIRIVTNPLLSEHVKPVIDGITARFEARIAALEAAVINT